MAFGLFRTPPVGLSGILLGVQFPVDRMLATSWRCIQRARWKVTLTAVVAVSAGQLVGLPWGIVVGGTIAALMVALEWSEWTSYHLDGLPHSPTPPAEYGERGEMRVVLVDPGRRWIDVVKVIREVRDLELAPAKAMIYSLPCVVAPAVSLASAERVHQRLQTVGAVSRIEPQSSTTAAPSS